MHHRGPEKQEWCISPQQNAEFCWH